MLAPIPKGKTTMTGGSLPAAVASRNHDARAGMPAIGLPVPCSQ